MEELLFSSLTGFAAYPGTKGGVGLGGSLKLDSLSSCALTIKSGTFGVGDVTISA